MQWPFYSADARALVGCFLNGSRDGFHAPAGEKTAIRSSYVGQGRASIALAMLSASASSAPAMMAST